MPPSSLTSPSSPSTTHLAPSTPPPACPRLDDGLDDTDSAAPHRRLPRRLVVRPRRRVRLTRPCRLLVDNAAWTPGTLYDAAASLDPARSLDPAACTLRPCPRLDHGLDHGAWTMPSGLRRLDDAAPSTATHLSSSTTTPASLDDDVRLPRRARLSRRRRRSLHSNSCLLVGGSLDAGGSRCRLPRRCRPLLSSSALSRRSRIRRHCRRFRAATVYASSLSLIDSLLYIHT